MGTDLSHSFEQAFRFNHSPGKFGIQFSCTRSIDRRARLGADLLHSLLLHFLLYFSRGYERRWQMIRRVVRKETTPRVTF